MALLSQRPFTIDGLQGCGSGSDPGLPGIEKVPPWWLPISFSTATELDTTWKPLESCSSKEPIYTLEVTTCNSHPVCLDLTLFFSWSYIILNPEPSK